MLETVLATIKQYKMLTAGDSVLCAVSGGADSVALLCMMPRLREELEVTVSVCHMNHMLRGAESDRDENFVKQLCARLNVPCKIARRDVGAYAKANKLGVEEAARNLRYGALREAAVALNADKIALAHTLDDNLETMLFHLARGTGMQGLGGIPPVRDMLIRPFIDVTREQIESFLYSIGQLYVNDSSNASTDYTRNRIRRDVVSVLREINPRCAEAAGRSARLLRKDEAYLTEQADVLREKLSFSDEQGIHLNCKAIQAAPDALRGRILRGALRQAGMPMAACSILLIRQLTGLVLAEKPDGMMSLPGGLSAVRQYDDLLIGEVSQDGAVDEIPLHRGERVALWQKDVYLTVSELKIGQDFNKTFNTFRADYDKIDFETLCVRTRRQGDDLRLTASGGHRSLKRLMIDKRIPRLMRNRLAVIADQNGVIAVQGLGANLDRQTADVSAVLFQFEGTIENEG